MREDLDTQFGEAAYIIPQPLYSAIRHGKKSVTVLSADTKRYICSSLLPLIYSNWSTAGVYFKDFVTGRGLISIKKTTEKHNKIIPF